MRLNGIEHFEMSMSAALLLILGTNGSGKSSLLWEISPVPANAADFSPGGGKTVELEHRGKNYELRSSFGAKQEHFFICDNEELNQGHTITVQKELVKQHFGVTNDIQELVCGHERFSQMSSARRKDWFLRLCDVNYDYALHVYGLLKNAHRDRAGAIRLERKALVLESEKLLSDQEISKIGEETKWLHECLSHLLEYRKPVETDLTTLELEAHKLDKQLLTLTNNFTNINQEIADREHTDNELSEFIETATAQSVQAETKISMLAEQHHQASQKIAVLQQAGESTIESLQQQCEQLQQELASKTGSLLQETNFSAESAFLALNSIKASLVDIFTTIPSNEAKRFSQASLLANREQLDQWLKQKNNILEQMAERRASLAHMRDHMGKPDVTCPKCNHAFSLIYSEERMQALIALISQLEDRLQTEVYPKVAELEAYLEECARYGSLYRQFVQLTSSTPILKPYWDWLVDKKTLTNNPTQGLTDLDKIESDLLVQIQLQQLRDKIAQTETNLVMLKSVGNADLKQLQQDAQRLEQAISVETQRMQVTQVQLQQLKAQLSLRSQAATIRKNIRKMIYSHRNLMQDQVEHHRRTTLNQLIKDLQSALATREHALFAANRQKDTVQSLAKKIQKLEAEEKALSILVKELSPSEGLIAEGMLGFIKNFCDQMNSLIAQVWTYPLEVKSCDVVEGETLDLDYKFPLSVGEEQNEVSDVAKGSDGMKEIVDLAFRIVAIQYLNLEDSALYLDEFSSTMDKQHRTEAVNLVKALVEQQTFTQVFLVSHYAGWYGALANAEICVLNETNILIPETYNKHVVMH